MNVWSHLPTIFKRRLALRTVGLVTLCVAFITTLLFADALRAAPGINSTLSFQGRLLSASGAVVPDGYYNMQFKIYQDGAGTTAGNPGGTLEWTESHVNNGGTSGVKVQNGFFSVNLGAVTPFGTSVDWNQDTLWLSMNIAGSSASCTTFGSAPCTADGEMLPMKRISSVPQAMNSDKLDGKDASDFIQNSTSPQTADFNISGTGTASSLRGTTNILSPTVDRADAGTLSIGSTNATTIDIGSNAISHTINIGTGNAAQTINIGTAAQQQTIIIGSTSGSSALQLNAGIFDVAINTNDMFTTISSDGQFIVRNGSNQLFTVSGSSVVTVAGTFNASGVANFAAGLNITGGTTYTTPGGANLGSRINIQNYTLPNYGTILAMGVTSDAPSTARGILVADARTTAHQATIGILSPAESQIFGLSWNGSNSTAYLSNTANAIALQANNVDVLTASNVSGSARVGVGNDASGGYNLDVTGSTRTNTLAVNESASSPVNGAVLGVKNAADVSLFSVNSDTANDSSVQIGNGTADSTKTVLTLDKASSAPTVTDSSAMLGSLYYDTTVGKIQCYEADGWGSCGNDAPDSFITISPEYAGAVLNGSGNGTLTAGLCSDSLNINDGSSGQPTICGTNETYNHYKWTSSQGTTQTYSMFVTHKLSSAFSSFVAGSTTLKGRTDSTYSTVNYQVYKNSGGVMTACGSTVAVSTGAQTTWQTGTATSTADPASCGFTAGDSIVFKINVSAEASASAYVSDINFAYSN